MQASLGRPPMKGHTVGADLIHFFLWAAVVILLVIGAIALGVKFFDTSTSESEHDHRWE